MEGLFSGEVHTEDCGLREEGGILMYPPVPLLGQYNVLGITLSCGSLAPSLCIQEEGVFLGRQRSAEKV